MNKFNLLHLLVMACLLILTACGSSNPTSNQTSGQNAPAPGTSNVPEGTPPASAEPIKVRLAHSTTDLAYLVLYIADAMNFFEEEGIELEITPIQGGGGPEMNALLAGEVELVGTNTPRLITLYNEGQPVAGIFNLLNRTSMNMVFSKQKAQEKGIDEDSDLETVLENLDGLLFGISRAGALTHQFALYYAARAGLDPEQDIQVVAVGGGSAMIASLEQGKIDAFINGTPVPEQAELRGGVMVINNSQGEDPQFDEFTQQLIVSSRDYINKNPEAISRIQRALQRAAQWGMNRSTEEIAQVVRPFFKDMEDDLLIRSIENVRHGIKADGKFTQRGIEANYEVLEAARALKDRPDWQELVVQ